MTRTFIALEMDVEQQRFLDRIIRQGKHLLPDLRWVEAEGIHLTLAFLGELDDAQLAKANAAATEAATLTQSFTYQLSGLGTFGPPRQPRVLWMGISEVAGILQALHRALALALEQQGFVTEKRPFAPHLTLARIKSPLTPEQAQILQQIIARSQIQSPAYRVAHLYTMKSELTPAGARYTCLQASPLR